LILNIEKQKLFNLEQNSLKKECFLFA
jgi:hypothetical protein